MCGKKLLGESIARHMRNVHNSSENNSEHETLSSNHKVECKECGKILSSKHRLKRHTQETHKRLKVECKECGKILFANSSLKRHTKRFHGPEKTEAPRSECKNCGKELQTESIPRHMRKVHNEKKTRQGA